MHLRPLFAILAAIIGAVFARTSPSEDGYDLWLRYRPMDEAAVAQYAPHIQSIVLPTSLLSSARSATLEATLDELQRGLGSMLNGGVPILTSETVTQGSLVIGTPTTSNIIRVIQPQQLGLASLGEEGYVIRRKSLDRDGSGMTSFIVIAANTDLGVLYGAFHFLRLLQTRKRLDMLDDEGITSSPKIQLRLLNHWDNLDGVVERGYSGRSIWDWWRLPDRVDPRYRDYARACASVGINGAVLNNVNAKPDVLTPSWIAKFAAVADALRPYGLRVYMSVRFSSPLELGQTNTADPLEPTVRDWWRAKADQIYAAIPDFGGWLVKASSEGQPGPGDYGRSHAEGANMLAAALAPHGGVVLWRAFVYSQEDPDDRAKQAYTEFKPLDGAFAPNVILQVKNGPIDFQPREPFHPLFGGMPLTQVAMEVQITKEYLGFSTHLAYLGPMWEEVLKADTHVRGPGSTVSRVIDGSLFGIPSQSLTAMAGVANIGTDRDWSGSHFDQANWYTYGRLAWDPASTAREHAEEWLRLTFSTDPVFVEAATDLMMRSRETVANYMTPLGLAHLMATGHHYGSGPWVGDLDRPEWNPTYYHQADEEGIGFDRTNTGSNALSQYAPGAAAEWANPAEMDDRYLLWFHHLPWDWRTESGRTLWDALMLAYDEGAGSVGEMRAEWESLRPYLDNGRFEMVATNLRVQEREARWWRDACIAFFQNVTGRPLPEGVNPPEQSLEFYKSVEHPYAPGNP